MEIVAYKLINSSTCEVTLDSPVSIADFASYVAMIYGRAIDETTVNSADISGLMRHNLKNDQADYSIGPNTSSSDLIIMGSRSPIGTHQVCKNSASKDNFQKFTRRLEEICRS